VWPCLPHPQEPGSQEYQLLSLDWGPYSGLPGPQEAAQQFGEGSDEHALALFKDLVEGMAQRDHRQRLRWDRIWAHGFIQLACERLGFADWVGARLASCCAGWRVWVRGCMACRLSH
jgi:hypothetical protein